jgi:hypothetical protein
MAKYYNTCPRTIPLQRNTVTPDDDPSVLSEFDKHRETLLTADAEEGWASELRRYLGTMQRDVTKNTDLVEWWQVRNFLGIFSVRVSHHHFVEQRSFISYTRTNCTRRPPIPSFICSLRAFVFRQQTNCNRPPGVLRSYSFRRIGNHGVCMETRPL